MRAWHATKGRTCQPPGRKGGAGGKRTRNQPAGAARGTASRSCRPNEMPLRRPCPHRRQLSPAASAGCGAAGVRSARRLSPSRSSWSKTGDTSPCYHKTENAARRRPGRRDRTFPTSVRSRFAQSRQQALLSMQSRRSRRASGNSRGASRRCRSHCREIVPVQDRISARFGPAASRMHTCRKPVSASDRVGATELSRKRHINRNFTGKGSKDSAGKPLFFRGFPARRASLSLASSWEHPGRARPRAARRPAPGPGSAW